MKILGTLSLSILLLNTILLSALLPLSAHAIVVQIDYEAYATNMKGTGLGFQLGDTKSGSLIIDTNRSSGDQWASDTSKARHLPTPTDHSMISGYHPTEIGGQADILEIYDDSSYSSVSGFQDRLSLSDSMVKRTRNSDGTWQNESHQLRMSIAMLSQNFIDNDTLAGIDIFENDRNTLSRSWLLLASNTTIGGGPGGTQSVENEVRFRLSSIRIKDISGLVQVSEPTPFTLLIVGLTALAIGRRQSKPQ